MKARLPCALVAGLVLAMTACGGPESSTSDGDEAAPSPAASETPDPTPTAEPSSEAPLTAQERRGLDERLVAAAWDNNVPAARRLIGRGADVNWRDDTVQSAFLIAASEGYLDLLNLTLENGADVDLHDSFDGTALIRAAERGHWDIVGRLLQTDIAVDHANNLGWVALHESIILGEDTPEYVATVRALIAGGADLRIPSERDGVTPVDHARASEQAEATQALERALRERPIRDPDAALLKAAGRGDADGVALAIRAGAELEAQDGDGQTGLLLASAADHVATAHVLLAMGASPDTYDNRSDTPWLVTGVTGSVEMADVMLRFHPDLTLRNRFGGVSIIPASERGHVAYVRRVADSGIDVNHVNDLGWTAMLEAVILGDGSTAYVEIVRILLGVGADPDIADEDGVTPLEHARSRGYTQMVRVLERAG